jgi:uncharacterized membrane protein
MLVQLGILAAIMLVLNFSGFASISIGPVNMTIMWVPIIIGAITLGPIAGAVLGGVFGATVLINMGVLTQILLGLNAPMTVIFMVVIRGMLVGFLSGMMFKGFGKINKTGSWAYEATGLLTSLMNTFMFIAGTALIFGANTGLLEWAPFAELETVTRGTVFTSLLTLVGMQALIEAGICTLVAATVARVLNTHLNKST